MDGQARITLDADDQVEKVSRVEWTNALGGGQEYVDPQSNCVDLYPAVFGLPSSGSCLPSMLRPVEDDTAISMYQPWADSARGGLPTITTFRGSIKVQFTSPLNASTFQDKGLFEDDMHPSAINASSDWQFPDWPADPTVLSCVWHNRSKLNARWAVLNKPRAEVSADADPQDRLDHSDDHVTVDEAIPAGQCAPGQWSYIGKSTVDSLDVESRIAMALH